MAIELGDRVKDRVTSVVGIATGRSDYMNGCRRFQVQPEKLTKEGEPQKDTWFDEPELVLVRAGVHAAIPIPTATSRQPYRGGPRRSGDHRRTK